MQTQSTGMTCGPEQGIRGKYALREWQSTPRVLRQSMAADELGRYALAQTDRTHRASSSFATVPRLPGDSSEPISVSDLHLVLVRSTWWAEF